MAVSGGKDSTLLLWTMCSLLRRGRIQSLKLLHFNHKTRSACEEEEAWLTQNAELLQLPLFVGYPKTPLGRNNLEHRAREERYAFFAEKIALGDRVYMGHHLDDSLEWSLMARFKSGRLKPQLGIPVVNGAFARPFLCVTSEQISRMVKRLQLDWLEDGSNQDVRFERNFLRTKMLPSVKKRFPGYLRHYVTSSNQLARKLGVWRRGGDSFFEQKALPLGGVGVFHPRLENTFWGAEELIRGIVEKLSSGVRGSLGSQVDKMIEAATGGRQGPIFFSGSVRGYMAPGVLFFVHRDDLGRWEQYDRAIVRVLEGKSSLGGMAFQSMGRGDLTEYIGQMPFPQVGLGDGEGKWNPGGAHFLLPRISSLVKKKGWQLNSLVKMARKMDEKRGKSRVLPLDLLARMGDFYCTKSKIKVRMEGRS